MEREQAYQRANRLLDELASLAQHPDLSIFPRTYDPEGDTIYLDVMPRSGPKWAETAYQFSKNGMKYDRDTSGYGIDGQPRVSYSGLV
jgi:hypothetical protein